jgi:hypothetical protein
MTSLRESTVEASGQPLANSFPNIRYHSAPIRGTGTETRESKHLRYAVNRRVAGSSPARGATTHNGNTGLPSVRGEP